MTQYDLIVIGAGPGGEVGAIRAAQLGLKVALVDKRSHLGGTCLNVGCIPTKALIESAKIWVKLQKASSLGFSFDKPAFHWSKILEQKEKIVDAQRKGLLFLMKKNKIDVFTGFGTLKDSKTVVVTKEDNTQEILSAKNILLATGSQVRHLPFAKVDGKFIHSSDTILDITSVPKTLAVIGGGVVGMEFASLFSSFGAKVTAVEMSSQIIPSEDEECAKELERYLKKHDVTILTNAKVESLEVKNNKCFLKIADQPVSEFDVVLVSVGRTAVIANMGLEALGIHPQKGFIPVDSHYRTSVPNIYAIGDIINTPALAHTASAEAMHAVEVIAGHKPPLINYEANPSAIYTYPEVASIGHKESVLKQKGIDYLVVKFPFAPLAKAKIEQATEGFIKLIYDKKYHEILGVHIVGAKATELIAEFSLGKILETTIEEIAQTIHPHPTLSETVMEAAHMALGGAIHL